MYCLIFCRIIFLLNPNIKQNNSPLKILQRKKKINNNSQQNPHGAFKAYCLNCVFNYMACFITFKKYKFVH